MDLGVVRLNLLVGKKIEVLLATWIGFDRKF